MCTGSSRKKGIDYTIKVKLEADEIPKPQLSEYAAKSPSEIAAKVALTTQLTMF